MSGLDRGRLAKIDRKVLAGLGHEEAWQMVRVPAANAMWSAWKRYCDSLGISMGRGIAALIGQELLSVMEDFEATAALLDERKLDLDKRERRLDERERTVEIRAQRVKAMAQPQTSRATPSRVARVPKVGRNEPCPCGSEVKFKRCHGR